MVEAPGTAPGSEWFITMTIYRHISCEQFLYRRARGVMQMLRQVFAAVRRQAIAGRAGDGAIRVARLGWS